MIPGIDSEKFKGFAICNYSGQEVALIIENDAAHTKEVLLKPSEVCYNHVGDVVKIYPAWFLRTCQGGKQISRTEIVVDESTGKGNNQ